MTQRMEVPVTTLADGTCAVIITPTSSLYGGYTSNGNYLPFVQVASTSSTLPFSAVGSYNAQGPFFVQNANVVTYATDALFIDFI